MQNVDFIITTLDRYELLKELLDSIFKFYPYATVTIADQSKIIDTDFYNQWRSRDLRVLPIPYDCGLSKARNILVDETINDYKLLLEDDFLFTKDTKIEKMVELMEIADIVGGGVYQGDNRLEFEHYFKKEGNTIYQLPDLNVYKEYNGIKYKRTGCVLNFALFNKLVFDEIMWYDKLKVREHQHFFYRCKSKIVFTDDVKIKDNKKGSSPEYKRLKGRDKYWKIALEDLGVKRIKYLTGKVVEIDGDKIQHYKEKKMIFTEQQLGGKFVYEVVDGFGTIQFRSGKKLDAEKLDQCFLAVFNIKDKSSRLEGTIKDTDITYKFLRKNQWLQKKKKNQKS